MATQRLAEHIGEKELAPLQETNSGDAVDLAVTPAGTWKGPSLFIYEEDGWTVFHDVSGHFGGCAAKNKPQLPTFDFISN